eukprot:80582-Rhodomonas_salina.1
MLQASALVQRARDRFGALRAQLRPLELEAGQPQGCAERRREQHSAGGAELVAGQVEAREGRA